MSRMEFRYTERGFERIEFEDRYRARCSLQKSSLAEEDAIWLGVDLGVDGEGKVRGGRMHLTQEMAADLLPFLQRFVEEGRLWSPEWFDENVQAAQENAEEP